MHGPAPPTSNPGYAADVWGGISSRGATPIVYDRMTMANMSRIEGWFLKANRQIYWLIFGDGAQRLKNRLGVCFISPFVDLLSPFDGS